MEKLEEILKSAKVTAPNAKKVIDYVSEIVAQSVGGDNSEVVEENKNLTKKITILENDLKQIESSLKKANAENQKLSQEVIDSTKLINTPSDEVILSQTNVQESSSSDHVHYLEQRVALLERTMDTWAPWVPPDIRNK